MAVSITQTANPAGVSASTNVATYSGVSIGTANPNRIVVVTVASELASTPIASCTLNGVPMNAGTQGNQGAVYARAFYLLYPTGTTADIAVTFTTNSPSSTQNHIAVYTVTDGVFSSTGANNSTDMDVTAPLTTGSTTIGTGGGMLAVAAGASDTDAKTWANLTEDIDADAGALRFTTATSITAGTATRTCTGGVNGEDGAMSWLIFADNSSPTVALSSPADAGSTSDTTPDLVFTGTDTDGDDVRYEVQVNNVNLFDIAIDSQTNSGEKSSVSSVTQAHTTGSLQRGAIFVRTMTRGGSDAALAISGITYNGVALTVKRTDQYNDLDAGQLQTEIWALINPASGTHDVVVTFGGTVNFTVVDIITLENVDQTNPTEAVGGGNSVAQASPVSNSATTVTKNAWLLDAMYHKSADTFTKGASQTQDSQVHTNTAGDTTITSHLGPVATPASTAMSWTYTTADDYAQSIVVVKPATLIDAVSGTDAGFVNPNDRITDNFNRADENPIGGNWTNNALNEGANNQLKIVSNQLMAVTAATSCEAYWNANTFDGTKDLDMHFTVVTKPGNGQRFEMFYLKEPGTSTFDGYQVLLNDISGAGNDTIIIQRVDNGSGTTLASATLEYNAGDLISFRRTSAGVYSVWINGVKVLQTSADTTYTGAFYAEVGIRDTTGVLDDWGVEDTDPFFSGQAVTYTVQSALAAGTYYWRVRAIDPSGSNSYGAWATTRSFTIRIPNKVYILNQAVRRASYY